MAGAKKTISIEIDSKEVRKALNAAIKAVNDISPALKSIGEGVVNSTKQRFADEESPDGKKWADLSALTKSRKRNNKILTESSALSRVHAQVAGNILEVGSNLKYAAMHQFGGKTSEKSMFPNSIIPARPFLGFTEEDAKEAMEILADYVSNPLR